MTDTKRWLEELPSGAPERDLLLAARTSRPPLGSVDEGWRALAVALGTTTITTAAAAANGAAQAAAGTTAAGAVSHGAAVGSFAIGVKWFVTGVVLGCGVSGAATVVERIGHRHPPRESSSLASIPPERRAADPRASRAHAAPLAAPPPEVNVEREPAADAVRAHESGAPVPSSLRREPGAVGQLDSGAREPSSGPPSPSWALSEQARELAEVKRLIDAGEAAPALARLEAGSHGGALLVLSEERDALYVQALAAARRPAEARARARAFLSRYPESPYLAAMRGLLTNE